MQKTIAQTIVRYSTIQTRIMIQSMWKVANLNLLRYADKGIIFFKKQNLWESPALHYRINQEHDSDDMERCRFEKHLGLHRLLYH
jgi:hypothetical protein